MAFVSTRCDTAITQGPHAYVSPRWYAQQPDSDRTWNYAVVQIHGIPQIISDETDAFAVMQRLVLHQDPEWQLSLTGQDRRELLREIVVFGIEVTRIDAKFKLSQNRSNADQANVAKILAKSATNSERETAALMCKLNKSSNTKYI